MKSQTWFEQKIENTRSWLNHYFPKFNNSENKWFGEIQNINPFTNGCKTGDSSGNSSDNQCYGKEVFS